MPPYAQCKGVTLSSGTRSGTSTKKRARALAHNSKALVRLVIWACWREGACAGVRGQHGGARGGWQGADVSWKLS